MSVFSIARFCLFALFLPSLAAASVRDWFEQRNQRFYVRGPWNWTIYRQFPELEVELNGIDFGHAHLAETLLHRSDDAAIEQARIEVLAFIDSKPALPPDEAFIAPTFYRLAWAPSCH
jgi:hypothetical protein